MSVVSNAARRALSEPLLHFAIIGALIFAAFGLLDERPPANPRETIAVTENRVARLAASFRATWRRAPTGPELDALIEDHIREEVYVREALSLGLDNGDTVIRRRLRQKMEFITDSLADAAEPDEAELKAFFEERRDDFALPPEIAFEQVFLGPSPPAEAAERTLAALRDGGEPRTLGARTLLPFEVPLSTPRVVGAAFGPEFFDRVAGAEPGRWSGPVGSAYGAHIVRVTALEPARAPALDEVRGRVEMEWRRWRSDALREETYRALRDRYRITTPPAAGGDGG